MARIYRADLRESYLSEGGARAGIPATRRGMPGVIADEIAAERLAYAVEVDEFVEDVPLIAFIALG